jgi:hypothetical protein
VGRDVPGQRPVRRQTPFGQNAQGLELAARVAGPRGRGADRVRRPDAPLVCDKAVDGQLAKQAIEPTVEDWRERAAAKARDKRAGPRGERSPRQALDSEHRANLRELTRRAHGVNVDLGAALLNDLAAVAPDDLDIARVFAYRVLGPESSSYVDDAVKWLWRFVDSAKTAGEPYGRALVVFAVQR